MASLSRFSNFSEGKLNSLVQEGIPEKTKIARKYGLKNLKGKEKKKKMKKNLKYQFDSFTRQIVAGVSSALVV